MNTTMTTSLTGISESLATPLEEEKQSVTRHAVSSQRTLGGRGGRGGAAAAAVGDILEGGGGVKAGVGLRALQGRIAHLGVALPPTEPSPTEPEPKRSGWITDLDSCDHLSIVFAEKRFGPERQWK